MLAWRIQVSPPAGPGSIGHRGKWLQRAIQALLARAGAPYVSAAQAEADAAAQEPVDEAASEEIHQIVADMKAEWDRESAERLSGITPLDDILPAISEEEGVDYDD